MGKEIQVAVGGRFVGGIGHCSNDDFDGFFRMHRGTLERTGAGLAERGS